MTEGDPDFWKDLLDETNGIGRKEEGMGFPYTCRACPPPSGGEDNIISGEGGCCRMLPHGGGGGLTSCGCREVGVEGGTAMMMRSLSDFIYKYIQNANLIRVL